MRSLNQSSKDKSDAPSAGSSSVYAASDSANNGSNADRNSISSIIP